MKKFTILFSLLISLTMATKAQIPNNGFESWTASGVESPTSWVSCNSVGDAITVTKSSDHFPLTVGSFAIRMQNYIPIGDQCKHGFANSFPYLGYWGPSFPITGHPNSLTGYYKFLPQNKDTMMIAAWLYKNGAIVASAIFTDTATVSSWKSFNIPIPAYISADSASIVMCAYYDVYGQYPSGPWGNSVLYIDNLNFDKLISGIADINEAGKINIYPNPASEVVTVNIDRNSNEALILNIYNVMGVLVKTETLKQNHQQITVHDLSNGIYMFGIKSNGQLEKQKLIIQR